MRGSSHTDLIHKTDFGIWDRRGGQERWSLRETVAREGSTLIF